MNKMKPTALAISTLPQWAQDHIAGIKRHRDQEVEQANSIAMHAVNEADKAMAQMRSLNVELSKARAMVAAFTSKYGAME